ncbi:Fet3 protein [Mycena floridula]|nr:Fet3 protein [Mycena floridula]
MRRALISLLASSTVLAGIHEVWWNLTYVQNVNPDGKWPRRAIGVNNSWPIPPVEINSTDSLLLHVTNSLDQPSTIHHHGMFFNSTSWMDGALGVTECGIPPGGQFDYVVPINSSGQWGSYWIHAHSTGQYVDGLRAPFLIHPPKEVHLYNDEFTVILGDWYHQEHPVLLRQFLSKHNPDGAEPVPNSGLIYFAQNSAYIGPEPGETSTSPYSAVGFNENATLPFEAGKTYRLRIINTSAFATFIFWVDGHDMRIIEVDGIDVQESPIDLVSIAVAQRYSVLVTARNESSTNWAIHANMDPNMFDDIPESFNPNTTASIIYSPNTELTDLGCISTYHDTNDTALIPIVAIPAPNPTKTLELVMALEEMDDGTNRGMFNRVTYNAPLVPAIFSALTLGAKNATVEHAYGPLSFVMNHLEVLDIVIKNTNEGEHPFHIHGHTFQIVGRSSSGTPQVQEGQLNPIRRDTIQIPGGHSATLRVVMDNPGTWLFHCHMEWHLEAGISMQLIEAPLLIPNQVPKSMYDNCAKLGKPSSGNAAGHPSTSDLTGLKVGPHPKDKETPRVWSLTWPFSACLVAVIVVAALAVSRSPARLLARRHDEVKYSAIDS